MGSMKWDAKCQTHVGRKKAIAQTTVRRTVAETVYSVRVERMNKGVKCLIFASLWIPNVRWDRNCPVNCGPNEMLCPKGADENGCELPGYCQHNDPTAICQTPCAPVCMDGEHPCPTQKDDRGCEMPASCSAKGECPA